MVRTITPDQVAKRYGVCRVTAIQWCEAGILPAVNVASPTATRKRWRMCEEDIEEFEKRRSNREVAS